VIAVPSKSRTLSVVTAETPAKLKTSKTVAQAAADGDRRELLVAMRSRVATAVGDPNTPARDLAALTRRLMEIAKDIEAIDAASEQEGRDGHITPDEEWDGAAI
jgi:hypothetical protein